MPHSGSPSLFPMEIVTRCISPFTNNQKKDPLLTIIAYPMHATPLTSLNFHWEKAAKPDQKVQSGHLFNPRPIIIYWQAYGKFIYRCIWRYVIERDLVAFHNLQGGGESLRPFNSIPGRHARLPGYDCPTRHPSWVSKPSIPVSNLVPYCVPCRVCFEAVCLSWVTCMPLTETKPLTHRWSQ